MAHDDQRGHQSGAITRAIAVVAGGLFLACLAGLGWLNLLPRQADGSAIVQQSPLPSALIARVSARFVATNGILTEADYQVLRRASTGAPLAQEPYLYLGAGYLADGSLDRGLTMLIEARRRQPRSRVARFLLLQAYLQTGRVADAAEEIDKLATLLPESVQLMSQQLVAGLREPSDVDALSAIVERHPDIYRSILWAAVDSDIAPDILLRLVASRPEELGTDDEGWQRAAINRLVSAERISDAYQLWQEFSPAEPAQYQSLVFNPGFDDRQSLAPFNWEFFENGVGVAELQTDGSVYTQFFGRENGPLVRQLVQLRPGDYTLTINARTGGRTGEGMFWQVACLSGEAPVLSEPFALEEAGSQELEWGFSIPASGCSAQWVMLQGRAQARRMSQRAILDQVSIARGLPAGAAPDDAEPDALGGVDQVGEGLVSRSATVARRTRADGDPA